MRLFIGLPLPDPVASHISTIRGSLPSVHWNNPDDYHIALCSFNEIQNHNLINDLDLAFEKIRFSSFDLTIQGVGHFTSSTHHNHFWTYVVPTPTLLQLKKKVEHTLQQFGIKPNKHRFTPHIALAQGIGVAEEQISNWLHQYNLFKTEPFSIHQFSLFSCYPTQHYINYTIKSNYLLR